MHARRYGLGGGQAERVRLRTPHPSWPLRRIREVLAALAVLAAIATPVQCSLAMGAHSLFVDPRPMMAADSHAGHAQPAGHATHADHAHTATKSASHHEAEQQMATQPAIATRSGQTANQADQSSQVNLPTLRRVSGFVDAAPPVALGTAALALVRRWAPVQMLTIPEHVPQPIVSWAESPPP